MKKKEKVKKAQSMKKNSKLERLIFLFKEHIFYYMCTQHREKVDIKSYFGLTRPNVGIIKSFLPIKTECVDYVLIDNKIRFIFHPPFYLKWKIMVATQPKEFYYKKWVTTIDEIKQLLNELNNNETNT